jgi:hypothetical protein
MKNLKRFAAKLLILTAILTTLSGCYWNIPVIDLIAPPKLTSEQAEIYNALINTQGAALTLKYPKTGEFLSAFVFNPDFDNQVMVFYEQPGVNEPTIRLTFLEKRDSRWVCTFDEHFFATDIERVEFSTLGDSDRQNIIISYSVLTDKSMRVFVFDENNRPEVVYTRDFFVYHEIVDLDNSGDNMLMSINQNEAVVEFAGWRGDRFVTPYSVFSNPNASEYVRSIQCGSTLFLEYSQSDNTFNTGIVVFREGRRPRNIVFAGNEELRREHLQFLEKRPNRLTAFAYSRDIDGGGVITSAGNRLFPGYNHESISASDRAHAAIWYQVTDNNRLERLYYTYLSVNNDYVFFFPPEWEESVTVTLSLELGEVTFWEFDPSVHESVLDAEIPLLSIISIPKEETRATGDYVLFSTDSEQFNFYVRVFDESIDIEDLEEMLRIL